MCGVIGIIRKSGNAILDGKNLLSAENNRGEQGAGAAVSDGKHIRRYCGEGLVKEVFGPRDEAKWSKLVGSCLVMHTLYSTIDPLPGRKNQPKAKHPMFGKFHGKRFALVHNGNLNWLDGFRKQASADGYKFQLATSDTEVVVAMLTCSGKKDFLEALVDVCQKLESHGSFSLIILYGEKLIGVRCGIRPLCIGKKHGKDGECNSYIFASESCVFATLDATKLLREVEHGELVVLGPDGQERSIKWGKRIRHGFCSCEWLYFSKPSTVLSGVTVARFRAKCGEVSARNYPVKADKVAPVPDSGRHYSDGWAAKAKIPTIEAFEKNHYGDKIRTFMEARETNRAARMRRRLQAIPGELKGLSAVLTEDTLIRASVLPTVVKMAREYGLAREVHVRICSPRICYRCHLGADIRTSTELAANGRTDKQINEEIVHADSLKYLTVEEFKQVFVELGLDPDDYCMGCFTGVYPINPPDKK